MVSKKKPLPKSSRSSKKKTDVAESTDSDSTSDSDMSQSPPQRKGGKRSRPTPSQSESSEDDKPKRAQRKPSQQKGEEEVPEATLLLRQLVEMMNPKNKQMEKLNAALEESSDSEQEEEEGALLLEERAIENPDLLAQFRTALRGVGSVDSNFIGLLENEVSLIERLCQCVKAGDMNGLKKILVRRLILLSLRSEMKIPAAKLTHVEEEIRFECAKYERNSRDMWKAKQKLRKSLNSQYGMSSNKQHSFRFKKPAGKPSQPKN